MSSLSDFDYINTLLLTYGELLTDKQKEIANLFFEFNLSQQEIADNLSISKQAVSDTLETVTSKLVRFEEKLKFFKKMQKLAEKVKDMTLGKNILGKQNKNVKLTYKDYIDLKTTAALVDTIEHIKDQEINQEKKINNQLMAENDKLSDEKSRYKLDLYK